MPRTNIGWTHAVWNPVTGCSQISPGCDHCYAKNIANRFWATQYDPIIETVPGSGGRQGQRRRGFEDVMVHHDRLYTPLGWIAPRAIFVNSMSDLFHPDIPAGFLDRIYAVMALADRHVFQVLTKRPRQAREYYRDIGPGGQRILQLAIETADRLGVDFNPGRWRWPLPNVWLGTSIELDRYAWRADVLREVPAAVHFVSAEPLLGPLPSLYLGPSRIKPGDIQYSVHPQGPRAVETEAAISNMAMLAAEHFGPRINWLIIGGESNGPAERSLVELCPSYSHVQQTDLCGECTGEPWYISQPDTDYRPKIEALTWVQELRDRAISSGVGVYFKQWGGPHSTAGGRRLDGRTWDEWPDGQGGIVKDPLGAELVHE